MRIAVVFILMGSCIFGHAATVPRITDVAPMDRWIDLSWTCEGNPGSGFAVAVSKNGRDFETTEHVGPEARSASVFVKGQPFSFLGMGNKLFLRVAALDVAGKPGQWSETVSAQPAKPRDIEAEVRQRFGYWEKNFSYSSSDPAYTVIYTDAQKNEQREAAKAMVVELLKVATNSVVARTFVIPPRVYRAEPGQLKVSRAENLTIQAAGVELIVDSEKSGTAFSFSQCTNIVLTGKGNPLIVDSEQFPVSVASIVAVDTNKLTVDIEVLPGYAIDLPESERMMAYDRKGRLLNVQQMGWKGLEKRGDRSFRLTTASLRSPQNRERVLVPGSLLALHNNEGHKRRTHGVVSAHECKDMTYEAIRVYNGGGSPADHGTAGYTVYRDWQLFPRPGTSRLPIATGLGQFSKNGGSFLFEDCAFGPHLDDGINLLSGMSIVGKRNSETEVVITGGRQPTIGSTLTFYDYTNWVNFGEAKVVSSERISDTNVLAEVNAFAKMNRTVQNARHAFRTMLDRPVKLTPFAMVVHSDYRADRIVVRGCLFRDQLAQIMLLQGAKSGLIENNLLLRSTGAAISPQFSQYWWEGPMPSNFMIRNNVIRDNPVAAAVTGFAGNASIAIYAGTKYPSDARLMRGFRVEGNTIINPSVYGICIRNAEEVSIRYNRIINPGAQAVEGMYNGRPISDLYAAICLDAVSRAVVSDNEIVYRSPRCQRAVLMETNCDATMVRIENNHETRNMKHE
jgi:hypothetical protein